MEHPGTKNIGFITCSDLSRHFPSLKNGLYTHDDQIAVDALQANSFHVEPVVWGTPLKTVLEKRFDLLVIRSPWDYMETPEKIEGFMGWLREIERSGIRLENPLSLVLWNLDKHYLEHLKKEGVDVVPTTYLHPGEKVDFVSWFEKHGEMVIKPCISAGGNDTFRIKTEAQAREFECGGGPYSWAPFEKMRKGRDFMVQPYLKEVTDGEWSMIFLDGEYSHAVLKRPKPGNWLVQDEHGGTVHWEDPSPDMVGTAREAFEKVLPAYHKNRETGTLEIHSPLLYGRVDMIDTAGGPKVGELELAEPELFFICRKNGLFFPFQPAAQKFVTGVKRVLGILS